MRRTIIHLGTHKTGTTSFQQFLLEQRPWLRSHGIEPYVETRGGHDNPNCAALVHELLRPDVVTASRYLGGLPPPSIEGKAALARHLGHIFAAAGPRDILFSAEAFGFFREKAEFDRLRGVLPPDFGEIVALVAFRRDVDWRRSWYAGMAGNPGIAPHMDDVDFPLLQDWWFEKSAIRETWSSSCRLSEVDYDAALTRDGSIIPALLSAIGLPPFEGGIDYWLNGARH